MSTVDILARIKLDEAELQRSTAATEQGIDRAISKKRKVPRPDTSAVQREFDRLARSLADVGKFEIDPKVNDARVKELQGLVEDIGNRPISLDVDGKPAAAEVQRVAKSLQAIDDAVVLITGDNSDLAAEVRESIGLVEAIGRVAPVIDITIKDQAIREARGVVEDLNQTVEIDVDADTSQAQAEFAALAASADFSGIGNKLTDSITSALSSAGPVGVAVAGASAAIGGLFIAGFQNGLQREQNRIDLAIQQGLSGPGIADAGEAAGAAYIAGFDDSLGDLTRIAATVEARLSDIDFDLDLEEATQGFSIIEQQLGIGVPRAVEFAQRAINQGLVGSTSEAIDLIISAAEQFGGLSEEIVDQLVEFGPFFSRLGFEGAQAANLIGEAWEQGLFPNIDRASELFEEFVVEVSTGAEPARSAIEEIGLDFEEMQSKLANGEGDEAITTIANALLDVEDASRRGELAVDIFRTAIEGASDPQAALQLLATADAAVEVGGSFERAAAQIEDSNAAAIAEFTRSWEVAFNDFSDGLVLALSGDDSQLEAAGERIGSLIGESIATGLTQVLPTLYSDVVPAIVDGLIPELSAELEIGAQTIGLNFGDILATSITGPLEGLGNVLKGDFSGAIDAISGEQSRVVEVTNQSRDAIDSYAESAQRLRQQNALGDAAAGAEELAGASADAAAEVAGIQEAFDALTRSIESEFDFSGDRVFRDLLEATDGLVDRFGDLSDVSVDFRGQIDQTTPAGRRLAQELEGLNSIQQDLIESTRQGSTSAQEFAERSAALESAVRTAGAAAGLAGPEIERLVERYLQLSDAPAAQLAIEVDEAAIARFRAQLDELSTAEQIRLGFDIDNESALEAAARANVLFESLSTSIPIVYDIDDNGLLSATEAVIGFNGLIARAELGFDFNQDGQTSAQEAADAWELGQFFADLGFDVNLDGIVDAEERAAAFEIQTALADLGYELDLAGLQQAEAEGADFDASTYEATADIDNGPASASLADADGQGNDFANTTFQAAADVDRSQAVGSLAEARRTGQAFANDTFTATATVVDRASAVLDQIARNRTSTIFATTIRRTISRGGGNTVVGDGGIVDSRGVEYMRDGGIADGIARAVPGGFWTQFNGRTINLAENGGDELFLNSKSRIERQLDLIRKFDKGRLDRDLRDHYTQQPTVGGDTYEIYATTPVADPVLAGEEIARAVARRREERGRRNQPARHWGPK